MDMKKFVRLALCVIAEVIVILAVVQTFAAELSYEEVNCDWNGSTLIIQVPMPAHWTWEDKEVAAETICDSIKEYEDQIEISTCEEEE